MDQIAKAHLVGQERRRRIPRQLQAAVADELARPIPIVAAAIGHAGQVAEQGLERALAFGVAQRDGHHARQQLEQRHVAFAQHTRPARFDVDDAEEFARAKNGHTHFTCDVWIGKVEAWFRRDVLDQDWHMLALDAANDTLAGGDCLVRLVVADLGSQV